MMSRFAIAASLAVALLLAPLSVAPVSAQRPSAVTQIPVVGAVVGGGTFTGTLNLARFTTVDGALSAVGTITGTLTNAAGQVTTVLQNVTLPVSNVTGTCSILHLDLGPLSLNILGLQVDLSRIVLDITAQTGAGNLLGNLLCAVANLLNDPNGLARLLNQILALL
jgi:hypothetical protein